MKAYSKVVLTLSLVTYLVAPSTPAWATPECEDAHINITSGLSEGGEQFVISRLNTEDEKVNITVDGKDAEVIKVTNIGKNKPITVIGTIPPGSGADREIKVKWGTQECRLKSTYTYESPKPEPTSTPTETTPTPTTTPTTTPTPTPTPTGTATTEATPPPSAEPEPEPEPEPAPEPLPRPTQPPASVPPTPEPIPSVEPVQPKSVEPSPFLVSSKLPELTPGQGQAWSGDRQVSVILDVNPQGQLVVLAQDFGIAFTSVTPESQIVPTKQGELQAVRGGMIDIVKWGALANSPVDVWIFSEPTFLGRFMSDAEGRVNIVVEIPTGLPEGTHTLQVNSLSYEGSTVSVAVGVNLMTETTEMKTASVMQETGGRFLSQTAKFKYGSSQLNGLMAKQLAVLERRSLAGLVEARVTVLIRHNSLPSKLSKQRAAKVEQEVRKSLNAQGIQVDQVIIEKTREVLGTKIRVGFRTAGVRSPSATN